MDLQKIYIEEDLFPREITSYERRDYGFLFYNESNRESYDSNHAVIFRNCISDFGYVLEDIIQFYKSKGIRPSIYQSIRDDGFFEQSKGELSKHGFDWWSEGQNYMVLLDGNMIRPNPEVLIKKVSTWENAFGTEIFEKAGEPWEIDVAKNVLKNDNTLFFVAYYQGKPVGMTHAHITDGVCRVDYLLVSKEHRNIGIGRTIINSFVEYCNKNQIENCYLWPDGDTAEKIYYEAGFRHVETKQAGRAVYRNWPVI